MLSRRRFLGTVAGAAAVTGFPNVVRGAPVTLKLPHATAESHPGHISAVLFKQELEKRLPGKVQVQIFPNRQLGDDKQNLESAIAGTTELGLASTVLVSLVTGRPAFDAWQLPFLIRDYDHFLALTQTETAEKMYRDLEPAGLVGLGIHDIGQRNFLSATKPVRSTADFAGLKTRIVPVPLHKAIWEAVGTNPIGLPYGEVYGALQTKVIDAVEINVSSIVGENLWEVGKSLTLTGHYPWPSVIVANKPFFDSQPPEIQKALVEAGRASIPGTLEYTKKQDLEARENLKAKGVQIFQLSDLDEMKKKVQPILDTWGQKSPLIAEFIKVAQAAA